MVVLVLAVLYCNMYVFQLYWIELILHQYWLPTTTSYSFLDAEEYRPTTNWTLLVWACVCYGNVDFFVSLDTVAECTFLWRNYGTVSLRCDVRWCHYYATSLNHSVPSVYRYDLWPFRLPRDITLLGDNVVNCGYPFVGYTCCRFDVNVRRCIYLHNFIISLKPLDVLWLMLWLKP